MNPKNRIIYKVIKRVIDSGKFILGKELEQFEKEVARCCKFKYGVGVRSITDIFYLLKRSGYRDCINLFLNKQLGVYENSGVILTNNKKLADRIISLRSHGCSPKNKHLHIELGTNSRISEIQAAILRVKLKKYENPNHVSRFSQWSKCN